MKQYQASQWIKRYHGGKREGWRATTLHRVSAKKWCSMVDAQLRASTPVGGLVGFSRNPAQTVWQSWLTWPHMTFCVDLGSDGLSGYMGCERIP